jgi:hypothetical protein
MTTNPFDISAWTLADEAPRSEYLSKYLGDDGQSITVIPAGAPVAYERWREASVYSEAGAQKVVGTVWYCVEPGKEGPMIWERGARGLKAVFEVIKAGGLGAYKIQRIGRKGDTKTQYIAMRLRDASPAEIEKMSNATLPDLNAMAAKYAAEIAEKKAFPAPAGGKDDLPF